MLNVCVCVPFMHCLLYFFDLVLLPGFYHVTSQKKGFVLFYIFKTRFNLTSEKVSERVSVFVHEGGSRFQLVILSTEYICIYFSASSLLFDLGGCFYGYIDGTNFHSNNSI